jgi:hypothetical protein
MKILKISFFIGSMLVVLSIGKVIAQDAAEMARMLQDPLANIKALMTDNDINFNAGNDQTSYGFQLQPVYAVSFDKAGFNLINRAVIPIIGMPPQGQRPSIGSEPLPAGDDYQWGMSDIALQFFFSPKTEAAWKWGLGPMFSLRTRTNDQFAGPGWGTGPIAVLVGGVGNLSASFIGGHLWGQQSFSLSILQPMLFYNIGDNGWTVHYNNIISHDWNASEGNAWTVPLGLGTSKTFALGKLGIEPLIGYYWNVVKPNGAADSSFKWAINFLF